jgi:mannan endo-1,4-beta-mannosidase
LREEFMTIASPVKSPVTSSITSPITSPITPQRLLILLWIVSAFSSCALGQQSSKAVADQFVTCSGNSLQLDGKPFRYSGPNIEWLGVEAYGPHDPQGPHYPTKFEIDDALDTAKEMGARVVRSQTMGDSVGCELCIEPKQGVLNQKAFDSIDYAIKAAHDRGLRLIITLVGDCATCNFGAIGL